jgi:mannan polymerase II complex MNN10 subunit
VKGAREWAIESISLRNKKQYAARWGYALEVANLVEKKQYSHEWRAGWEKVDIIEKAMREHRDAEWYVEGFREPFADSNMTNLSVLCFRFWWLDLNTIIMEPSYSLQSHIFNSITDRTYRDINVYNPQKIEHPPSNTSGHTFFLDEATLAATGDNRANSIDFVMAQDCGGFSLGSFFIRRSEWSERILDAWWDPIVYEQRHMQWAHKEQDAFQHIYTSQPWIRSRVAFLPQRMINAYPEGACGNDKGLPRGGCPKPLRTTKVSDPALAPPERQGSKRSESMKECGVQGAHYQARERDFLVNMAGCEFGRDCAAEMEDFAELSSKLNRGRFKKFWDWATGKDRKDEQDMAEEKERREKAREEWARLDAERKKKLDEEGKA